MRRPFMIRSSLTLIGVAAGLSLAACTSTENSNSNIEGTLSAAGASFPAAIYQRWFSDLAPQGIRVNYQSVGSVCRAPIGCIPDYKFLQSLFLNGFLLSINLLLTWHSFIHFIDPN